MKFEWLALLALIAGGAAMTLARGIRNNNPLNIKYNAANQWVGAVGQDGPFVVFSKPEYGVRAAFKILNSYKRRGINTIRSIVSTWAPPSENDTNAYIDFVVNKTHISPDRPLSDFDKIEVLQAMSHFENGAPIARGLIERGRALV